MAHAFAGPFCRYFARSPEQARTLVAGIEAWRRDLAQALAGRRAPELVWAEDPDDAGFTADLGCAGWPALRLFAFYSERSELELPDAVPALLELDRDYRTAHDQKFAASKYGQLLACTVWLPIDTPLTFRVPLPDGESAEVGSLAVLVDQLRWLNQRTFAAEADVLAAWTAAPAATGGALLPAAQRGLGGLTAAAARAVARRVPLFVREA